MDNTAKAALAFGGGVVAGRVLNNSAWLLAAGALVLFFAHSTEARSIAESAAKKGYSGVKTLVSKK